MIYLDNHATTPVDPRVLERMLPYFTEHFGNAASRNHAYGWRAEEAADVARERVAELIGATGREIIFCSGATEANNLAILGAAEAYASKGKHLVTQATEHKAVLDPLRLLAKRGYSLTVLPVDAQGSVDPAAVRAAITDETILVSVMAVNNEIGTLQPVAEIGAVCKAAGVLFHTDAAQAAGRIPIAVERMGIDLLSLSGHKLYGPKGVGALYVRRRNPRVALRPLIHGGGHERGLRSGTLNVPGIVGLGEACHIAREEMAAESQRLAALRDRLWERLESRVDGISMNGHRTARHPGNLHVSFRGIEAEALIMGLREVAVSSGAACASATLEPSHVLRAIGLPEELARSSVRFGIGRFNTEAEVDRVASLVAEGVRQIREING